jgi:predicted CXXCH cytochrome family protein
VAIDAFGGGGTPTLVIPTTSAAYIGNDLTNDHPISITFDAGGAEFETAVAGMVGSGGADSVPLYGSGLDQVECGSCHNPHDATGVGKFLRFSEAAVCTLCHIK